MCKMNTVMKSDNIPYPIVVITELFVTKMDNFLNIYNIFLLKIMIIRDQFYQFA